ncbi:MAG: signal peptide peptidase SppA [Pseudopedobacter saltans]|uniref:Signal peptide peptidase SppA n=1 Tax=Pseudopedobacter saltans TaxID=151895 RepID=A0A2W5GYI9_9SPHI|nr:MAG: signal peptide peptidase SppA [Pseudopedobacter saltans]
MKGFFKIFFASLAALIVFTVLAFFLLLGLVSLVSSSDKPDLGNKGILVLDLNTYFDETGKDKFVSSLLGGMPSADMSKDPSLYDVIRMLEYAAKDSSIKMLYIKANGNANSYAHSEELRSAIEQFKTSKKPVIAYGDVITQKSYFVASEANKVYCNPAGGLEWKGMAISLMFYKGLLDKLEIQPEIFYAGKFKSATEPFRATQMTDANRLQTTIWLNDLYTRMLEVASKDRNIDTATLRNLANSGEIRRTDDAVKNKMIDCAKYDDEVKTEMASLLKVNDIKDLNFIPLSKYAAATDFKDMNGKDKIAVIYANGDIVDGQGTDDNIGSDRFRNLIRDARTNKDIKAIVLRVNSPGGSALASEIIWREVSLAKKVKPVVVSMGTYAASGGYYISSDANYIFADQNTLTGSIGVFSMMINTSSFLKNKLGVTFDGVKTAQYADLGYGTHPMTQQEKNLFQYDVDTTYHTFLTRVAEGRKKTIAEVDSIAQGRVWTGKRAISVGLVDANGTLKDAIAYAAKLAKSNSYYIKEYPENKNFLEKLISDDNKKDVQSKLVKDAIGDWQYDIYSKVKSISTMCNSVQMRIPFEMEIR